MVEECTIDDQLTEQITEPRRNSLSKLPKRELSVGAGVLERWLMGSRMGRRVRRVVRVVQRVDYPLGVRWEHCNRLGRRGWIRNGLWRGLDTISHVLRQLPSAGCRCREGDGANVADGGTGAYRRLQAERTKREGVREQTMKRLRSQKPGIYSKRQWLADTEGGKLWFQSNKMRRMIGPNGSRQ